MPLTNHIAIYGGSYNPPHFGHIIACIWLRNALNAKEVHMIPTCAHYFNKPLIPYEHRVNMCKLIAQDYSYIKVSEAEIHLPKPNTTLNLVKYYKILYPDTPIAVVIGSDLVPELHKWYQWDEVAETTKVVSVGRSGFKEAPTPLDIYQYPVELSAISSSDIRKRIGQNKDITGLVSANIKRYINAHGLYYDGY